MPGNGEIRALGAFARDPGRIARPASFEAPAGQQPNTTRGYTGQYYLARRFLDDEPIRKPDCT